MGLGILPQWLLAERKYFSPLQRDWLREQAESDEATVKAARQEIRKVRMAELDIQVLDFAGKPLRNTNVELVQLSHSFPFGDCNPGMDAIFRKDGAGSEHLKQYRKLFASVLNAVNSTCYWSERPRNNMAKTEEYLGEPMYEGFADTVNWGNAHGLLVKGHPLFWPVEKAIPEWIRRYDYPTQLKFLEVRLRQLVGRFKGRVKMWDAVNEMLWEPALKNLSSRNWPHLETMDNMVEYISMVLHIVREEDPDAIYLLNDYGLETPWPKELKSNTGIAVTHLLQRKRYLELLQRLQQAGSLPNAIGLQGHGNDWQMPTDQMAYYTEMSSAGLPIHITEFWAHTDHLKKEGVKLTADNGDFITQSFQNQNAPQYTQQQIDAMQAEYVANYLTCAFAHPSIDAFFFWGFMSMAVEWKENDLPAYELKPVYHAVKNLIHEEWNTQLKLNTNGDGLLQMRGFSGDYSLRVPMSPGSVTQCGVRFFLGRQTAKRIVLRTLAQP
ncbi:MAG TPA: endo-1,4-beta-xylanase [Phnomibacter sp.]|nr:endo-1,4-beta-xylanase [Phnomibacter sp.]